MCGESSCAGSDTAVLSVSENYLEELAEPGRAGRRVARGRTH